MRRDYDNMFEMSSGLFNLVDQPDTYWVFEGTIRMVEESLNEHYEEVKEESEPEGEWFVSSQKASELLSRLWVETFDRYVSKKYRTVRAVYTGVYRPKQYNFSGDTAGFTLICGHRDYDKICREAMHAPDFEEWLGKTYRSYDGFWSAYPDNLQDFLKCMNGTYSFNPQASYTKALVVALTFMVLKDMSSRFDQDFHDGVEELDFSQEAYFEPLVTQYDDRDNIPEGTKCACCFDEIEQVAKTWGSGGSCVSAGYGQWICPRCKTVMGRAERRNR